MTIPLPDITALRATIGAIGMNVDIMSTNQTYFWDNTSTLVDNGITQINVAGVAVGGWRLQVSDSGFNALSLTSMSGTTAETTIFSKVIKGNTLMTSRSVSFLLTFRVSSGITLLPTVTLKAKYGSGTLTLANAALLSISLSNKSVAVLGRIAATGATNSQHAYGIINQDAGTLGGSGQIISTQDMTVDSTVDQTFSFTAQLSATTGSVTLNFMYANVILL